MRWSILKIKNRPRRRAGPDYLFISIVIFLVIFGLVMLTSASSDLGKQKFNDGYYYLKHQILYGLITGLFGFGIGVFIYYRVWASLAVWLLLVNIILLILVFTPLGKLGNVTANRWLNLTFFSFQPGELMKLTFLIYLAAWLSRDKQRSLFFTKGFLPFLIICGIVSFLLFIQPATTITVIILSASLLMYFLAGAKLRFMAAAALLGLVILAFLIFSTPYRYERVISFLNPDRDPLGANYHLNQAEIAIGSGGLFGVGFGRSTTKLKYLPEPISDSIFAVVAEEFGFVGSLFLVILFLILIWRGLAIAKQTRDSFGRFLAAGFTSLIGLQAFINIAATTGVIPLTGIPLPFISYGGTALFTALTMAGILVNISKYR